MRKHHSTFTLLLVTILILCALSAHSEIYYVAKTGDDGNDGSSWAQAKLTVQAGINTATPGDEVWVASGTYVQCLTLTSGVKLYGGFPVGGAGWVSRDSAVNETILDANEAGSVINVQDNANENTVIDGFTIQNGKASNGGGIYCSGGSPVIKNNLIKQNTADGGINNSDGYGGGIYCSEGSPKIINNRISSNNAKPWAISEYEYGGGAGGGIYTQNSTSYIEGNLIENNDAGYICIWVDQYDYFPYGGEGGGIYCTGGATTITGNQVRSNVGHRRPEHMTAGGIYFDAGLVAENFVEANSGVGVSALGGELRANRISKNQREGLICEAAVVVNNLISRNGGGIVASDSSYIINNNMVRTGTGLICKTSDNIIWNNIVAFNSVGIRDYYNGTAEPQSNCVYGNVTDYSNCSQAPTDISEDPIFECGYYSELHIQSLSPCKDRGNSAAPHLPELDIDGQQRIVGSAVDIGADESDGTQWPCDRKVVFVDASAQSGGDGSSWEGAFTSVSDAIAVAQIFGAVDIWIADGVYQECITLPPGCKVYGGFAGSETESSQALPLCNRTVIDGGGVSESKAIEVIGDGLVTGLTIINASVGITGMNVTATNNTVTAINSYAITCFGDSVLTNNLIVGNVGEGIRCSDRCTVEGNTIAANLDYSIVAEDGASMTLTNNIIAYNCLGLIGDDATWSITSCNIYGNGVGAFTEVTIDPGNLSQDPMFVDMEYGDFHILPESPCKDAGSLSQSSILVDIDGQSRMQGSNIDIGADECDGSQPIIQHRVLHINSLANDGGDGTSWGSAYKTIGSAAEDVRVNGPAEVWVAAGTYEETVNLPWWCHLYGGFVGSEADREDRDYNSNVTTMGYTSFSGDVVRAKAMCTVDGFTIRGGNGIQAYSGKVLNNIIDSGKYSTAIQLSHNVGVLQSMVKSNIITADHCGINCSVRAAVEKNIVKTTDYGIQISGNAVKVRSNVISGARRGIYCTGLATITGNTISGCSQAGIYWYVQSDTGCKIANNIISFSEAGVKRLSSNAYAIPVLSYNDFFGNVENYVNIDPGIGDMCEDPLFVNSEDGDYHLTPVSPCINAGSNTADEIGLFDIDGEGRISGGNVDIGADEYWPMLLSVSDLKATADGAVVSCNGVVVSAAFSDFSYVESPDCPVGIRLEKSSHGLSRGTMVDITGSMHTNSDGERYILADTISSIGTGSVTPLFMLDKVLGGDSFGFQQGVMGGIGLNNIGLFVKIVGKVTQIDPAGTYFYIDDGSNLQDSTQTGEEDNVGVRVAFDGTNYSSGQRLAIKCISSCKRVGNYLVRLLRVESINDIQSLN
ncbi:MAG: choice-of-anchor Q domain-containing protein [Armatimonadota bacterium]|nr:right-handed parallel beta-helix repeat-containing protein [bacterium]